MSRMSCRRSKAWVFAWAQAQIHWFHRLGRFQTVTWHRQLVFCLKMFHDVKIRYLSYLWFLDTNNWDGNKLAISILRSERPSVFLLGWLTADFRLRSIMYLNNLLLNIYTRKKFRKKTDASPGWPSWVRVHILQSTRCDNFDHRLGRRWKNTATVVCFVARSFALLTMRQSSVQRQF